MAYNYTLKTTSNYHLQDLQMSPQKRIEKVSNSLQKLKGVYTAAKNNQQIEEKTNKLIKKIENTKEEIKKINDLRSIFVEDPTEKLDQILNLLRTSSVNLHFTSYENLDLLSAELNSLVKTEELSGNERLFNEVAVKINCSHDLIKSQIQELNEKLESHGIYVQKYQELQNHLTQLKKEFHEMGRAYSGAKKLASGLERSLHELKSKCKEKLRINLDELLNTDPNETASWNSTYASAKEAMQDYKEKIESKRFHEIDPSRLIELRKILYDMLDTQAARNSYMVGEKHTLDREYYAAKMKLQEAFPSLNPKNAYLNIYIDNVSTRHIERKHFVGETKINGKTIFENRGRVLISADRMVRLSELKGHLNRRQVQAQAIAECAFRIACKLDKDNVPELELRHWEALNHASQLVEAMISEEGTQLLNEKETIADYLLHILWKYSYYNTKNYISEDFTEKSKVDRWENANSFKAYYNQFDADVGNIMTFLKDAKLQQ